MAKRRPSGDGMVRKREDGRWEGRIVVGHKEKVRRTVHVEKGGKRTVWDTKTSAGTRAITSYYDYSSFVFCSMKAAEGLVKGWGDGNEDGISEAYYYVTDAAQLDQVIRNVQSISSINWNNYKITANDEVYQNISSSLSDTGTLITTLIVIITAVSMVLMILILSVSIRSRKRETGILLAVGIAKPAIILQYVMETLLIATAAFPLAYLSSKQVAGVLGALFGKTAPNVVVTPEHFILVAIVGGILLIAAVLVSCISAMRLKPKQILSQME